MADDNADCFPQNCHVESINMTNVKNSLRTTEPNSFNILHLNARSLKNKFEEFELLLESLGVSFSCIVVSETWFNDVTYLDQFKLSGYDLFCSSRSKGNGGGIFIYVTDQLETRAVGVHLPGSESLQLFLFYGGKRVATVFAVYRSPSGGLPVFLDGFSEVMQSLPINSIVVGDIYIDLCPENIQTSSAIEYETVLNNFGFYNVISSPTRICDTRNSLIDHIIYNNIENTVLSCTLDSDFADHRPIVASFKLESLPKVFEKYPYDTMALNYQQMYKKLRNFDWHQVRESADANQGFKLLIKTLKEVMIQCSSSKPIHAPLLSKFKKPWMNSSLFKLIARRSRMHKQLKSQPFNTRFKNQYKTFRNFVTLEIKKAKINFYSNEFKNCCTNQNEKWKFINRLLKKDFKTNLGPQVLSYNNKIIVNANQISECFNNHFVNIGVELTKTLPKCSAISKTNFNSEESFNCFDFYEVESSEILELINSFGVRKARGYDEISIRTIKENKLSLVPVLTHLINLTIKSSEFPDGLKIARVTPLFKKRRC